VTCILVVTIKAMVKREGPRNYEKSEAAAGLKCKSI
jgi:hypothetical protein